MKSRYFTLPAIFGLVAALLIPLQPPATLSADGYAPTSTQQVQTAVLANQQFGVTSIPTQQFGAVTFSISSESGSESGSGSESEPMFSIAEDSPNLVGQVLGAGGFPGPAEN